MAKNMDSIIGKSDYQLPWRNEDAAYYKTEDKKVMDTATAKLDFEEPYADEDDMRRWVSTSLVPLKNTAGDVSGILGTYHDITAKKENENNLKLHRDELEYQATHDPLTKLPNRILFLDRLNHALYLAKRNQTKVAVLFIDMDRFKGINDSLGHAFGDLVIKEVAQRIKEQIRIADTVARFGGDEFVMFIDNILQTMTVTAILGKLTKCLESPIIIENYTLHITVSIGVSIYPYDAENSNDLLKNADVAMYKAKSLGGNNYQFYTEDMTQKALARMELEHNLRSAINNEDFILYYQPQFKVGAVGDKIVGMEALIRWKDADNSFISPDTFIPLAEDTGLIIPLGKWIMKEGMRQMVEWYNKGLNPGVLALNFSMLQLQEHDFVFHLGTLLELTECKAHWIEIEITETQMMKNPEVTISTLKELHTLGIKIAIDDFGTGYSSLSYLKRLPIDTLKIDKAFIENLPEDEENLAITKAIFALAKSLNLAVVAEGVETVEQKNALLENGCQYIQGYHYARPMNAEAMENCL
jgi:diguanylate cyclase (GGDEF)-like protein